MFLFGNVFKDILDLLVFFPLTLSFIVGELAPSDGAGIP